MRVGDPVRFAKWEDVVDINDWSTTPKNRVGILIEYSSLMKTAVIFYKGETVTCRAHLVEKAGRRDVASSVSPSSTRNE